VDIHITGVMDSIAFQKQVQEMKGQQQAQFEQQKPALKEQSEKYFNEIKGKNKEQWLKDSAIIKDYIKKHNLKVQSLPSGLFYVITDPGSGKQVEMFDTVAVNYKGYLTNGEPFDESRGNPFSFMVGIHQVIAGWDEGLPLFKQGGKGKLIIPSYLAYGDKEMGGIPANSVLIFDIEVVDVK
jgi:FKBP-type peptidyl-prolyl cis-trans isomerase FkpA